MDLAFAESVFHSEHEIAGLEMQSLTIWHFFLLQFCECPWVTGTGDFKVSDLALALVICSQPASHPRETHSLNLKMNSRLARRVVRSGMGKVSAQFGSYLRDHLALPECWSTDEGKPIKSNICLYLVASLIANGAMTEQEAWGSGFSYARHLVLALAEADGNEIPLLTAREKKALREAGQS